MTRISLHGALPWRANADADYFEDCQRCEKWVMVNADAHRAILGLLDEDKRAAGNHGMCLLPPGVPNLDPPLEPGDRLEPCMEVQDVGRAAFAAMDFSTPRRVLFWRCSAQNLARHRNPLFDQELGLTPHRSLTVDLLHALFLGVMLAHCKLVVWFLIGAGQWGLVGTLQEQFLHAVVAMRQSLQSFLTAYRISSRAAGETGELTKVRLKPSVLGSQTEPNLKTKGAETWTMCLFLADTLAKSHGRFGPEGKRLNDATAALVALVKGFKAADTVMGADDVVMSLGLLKRYMVLTACYEDLLLPKRHIMLHMLLRTAWFGNPNLYATWLSESLNKLLKKSCRNASQGTFDSQVLLRMYDLLRPASQRSTLKRALADI